MDGQQPVCIGPVGELYIDFPHCWLGTKSSNQVKSPVPGFNYPIHYNKIVITSKDLY